MYIYIYACVAKIEYYYYFKYTLCVWARYRFGGMRTLQLTGVTIVYITITVTINTNKTILGVVFPVVFTQTATVTATERTMLVSPHPRTYIASNRRENRLESRPVPFRPPTPSCLDTVLIPSCTYKSSSCTE